MSDGAVDLRRLLRVASPDTGRLTVGVVWGSLALGSAVALMACAAWLISRAAEQPPVLTLTFAVVGVRAFALTRALARYLERLASHDAAFRMLATLRVRVHTALEPLAPAGLPAFRRGDLLARLVDDVDTMQDLPLRVVGPVLTAAVAGAASVLLVGTLLPTAGAVLALALLTSMVAVPAATAWAARRADRELAGLRGRLQAQVVELLDALPDLVVTGEATSRLRRVEATDAELTAAARATAAATGLGAGLAALGSGLAVWGTLLVGVPAVTTGSLDAVWLAAVVLVPLAAFEAVHLLPPALSSLRRVRVSGARLLEVLDAPVPVPEPTGAGVPAPDPTAGPPHVRLSGVVARWPGAAPDAPDALRGVDLDLPPGRRVALLGPSGSGKTTLASVLLRFVDVRGGTYTLDGVDVRGMHGDDVRRVVGLAAQDAHVFDSTVRENLRLARPAADDGQLHEVLGRVGLAGWVRDLPQGLDTWVGERGDLVSGGQRQRLAVARALLADVPVLVLDEPTANVDPATADALVADLLTAAGGRTVVLITHHLGLAADLVDEVVSLADGRVVPATATDPDVPDGEVLGSVR
ncbi:thiol reductant ABC exporter subunit CydC [Aquipuribacter sp. MA13-6]|uniref:thiol reductant ABC exporter subunit CydC n=1 Tax=unclassified Aquipuribacter TaxID=2635084 RepID=UPI003EE917C2